MASASLLMSFQISSTPSMAGRKEKCHVLQQKIRYALYMVQTNRTEDEQGEQQGQTEHVAGQQTAE